MKKKLVYYQDWSYGEKWFYSVSPVLVFFLLQCAILLTGLNIIDQEGHWMEDRVLPQTGWVDIIPTWLEGECMLAAAISWAAFAVMLIAHLVSLSTTDIPIVGYEEDGDEKNELEKGEQK